MGDALVSGTIDALLADGMIIDYKTGAFTEARHARYEWQLLLYAAAVHRLLGLEPRTGMLYYVDEDRVSEVNLSADQVESALRDARAAIAEIRSGG